MRLANLAIAASAILAFSICASAQNGYPQPYNPDDPNNYSSPAAQQYGQDHPPNSQAQRDDSDQTYNQGQQAYDEAQETPYAGQPTVAQPPPPLPQYEQPEAPGDGYQWTPGYWAYGPTGYYWIPGAWRPVPFAGALWTPGYWAYAPIGYFWNPGCWGLTVGYYGGINYGYGYFGRGFYGGYWNSGRFFYNREYAHGPFGFSYTQRSPGELNLHPGGRSFVDFRKREGFRGEAFTQRGTGTYSQGGTYRQPYPMGNIRYPNRQIPMANTNRTVPNQSFGGPPFGGQFYGERHGGYAQPRPITSASSASAFSHAAQSPGGASFTRFAPSQGFHPSAPAGNFGGYHGGGALQGGGNRSHR